MSCDRCFLADRVSNENCLTISTEIGLLTGTYTRGREGGRGDVLNGGEGDFVRNAMMERLIRGHFTYKYIYIDRLVFVFQLFRIILCFCFVEFFRRDLYIYSIVLLMFCLKNIN